jgi:hypothetical protein
MYIKGFYNSFSDGWLCDTIKTRSFPLILFMNFFKASEDKLGLKLESDSMSQRKYCSEFALNMLTDFQLLLQQKNLDEIDNFGIEPHIYFICRRPRITLVPNSVKFTAKRVTGEFRKQIGEQYIALPFVTNNNLGTSEITLQCSYPYTEFAMSNKAGRKIMEGRCALLLAMAGSQFWQHLDLEVLYIGQAYGKDGSRKASERLKSHSTLQGIYAEAIRNSPDKEIWLILSTFKPLLLATFDGRSCTATTDKEDDEHLSKVTNYEMTEHQQINFTEAALIKYFQPSYSKLSHFLNRL